MEHDSILKLIVQALVIINKLPVNKSETFRYLCALNLLNALVKQPLYKTVIGYRQFKPKVNKLIRHCISNKCNDLIDSIWYNQDEQCAYLCCFGLQFTFHCVATSGIFDFINSTDNRVGKWNGIRLQPIAIQLFYIAEHTECHYIESKVNNLIHSSHDDL